MTASSVGRAGSCRSTARRAWFVRGPRGRHVAMTASRGQTRPEDVLDESVLRPVAHLHHAEGRTVTCGDGSTER